MKFVEKNSILKKINEFSEGVTNLLFLEVTNLTNLANRYPNGDGMEHIKIGLRQKKLSPGGMGAVRLIR